MVRDIRPVCEKDNCSNLSQDTGHKRKDGSISYRRQRQKNGNMIFVCAGHHKKHYFGAPWTFGSRDGESRGEYMQHRKTYCENIDGRLGVVCTSTIVNMKQLCVDHVLENFSTNDKNKNEPENLQTLCHNCHNLKNDLVAKRYKGELLKMVEFHFNCVGVKYTKRKGAIHVNKMIKNAQVKKKIKSCAIILIFCFTLCSCSSRMEPSDIIDRTSGEISSTSVNSGEYLESSIMINYKLWRFK